MQNISNYDSLMGKILISADEIGLVGIWFENQKYFGSALSNDFTEKENEIIKETKHWLDLYFKGIEPDFMPQLHLIGSDFQLSVWRILQKIPYGKTVTYGDIAKEIANMRDLKKMSAQAVGHAVGHNPISIIIPCHRVISSNYNLTGYAGGIDKKIKLLELEGVKTDKFKHPRASF